MTVSGWVPRAPRPGTNLKGDAAGAAWTYLLDRIEAASVLCIGAPGDATLRTLRRISRRLDVVDAAELQTTDRSRVAASRGRYDLVFVAEPIRRNARGAELVRAAARALAPGGTLWAEATEAAALTDPLSSAGLGDQGAYWLTPRHGELRTAVPLSDEAIGRFFVAEGVTVPSLPPAFAPIEGRWPKAGSRRVGVLAREADGRATHLVPGYLRELARASGIDLDRHRLGLSARGTFNSRKVVAYVFEERSAQPEMVVKMTREPSFNERLENEERILRMVAAERLVEPGAAPAVRFGGEHAGLRVLAEDAIQGIPMRNVAGDDAIIADAYSWVTDLGAASARRGPEAAAALRSAAEAVGDGVFATYGLDKSLAARLTEAVDAVTTNADRLPAVLMHGDCGLWNAWLRPDGRIAFLDWEASAGDAPPLWDLFSLAGSHVVARALWRGRARRPSVTVAALTEDAVIREAIRAYCDRLRIAADLVAPLFSLACGFRALREASRLRAQTLERGRHFSLLRASLDPQVADDLERRFSEPAATAL